MTNEEFENLTLIERLEYDIAFEEKYGQPLDIISWRDEYGISVTVNEAKLFVELLKSNNPMENYETLTLDLIPGYTPREKYDSMVKIAQLLNDLSCPKRGEEKSLVDLIEQALDISDEPIEIK